MASSSTTNSSTLHYGFAPEEVVGTNAFDWVHPEDLTTLRAEFYAALQEGQASVGVYRIRSASGEWRWVESVGTNHLDDPAVRAIVVNTRDVTERVRTEQAMRESENRFRSMVQNGSDMIGLLTREGVYLYVSESVHLILGYSPEELVGHSAFEFTHPDEGAALQGHFAALLGGRETKIEAFRFRRHDGEWRWIETVLTNLLDDPHVQAVVANSRDVTEAKQVVEALQQSENRFRTIVETSREGIWMLDENGNTVYVNGRMAEMLGYTRGRDDGPVSLQFHGRVGAAEAHRTWSAVARVHRAARFPLSPQDGHDVWTIIATNPLPSQNGEFTELWAW
jgi:PAS domain S-box-containing protein